MDEKKPWLDSDTKRFLAKGIIIIACCGAFLFVCDRILPDSLNPITFLFNKVVPLPVQDWCTNNISVLRTTQHIEKADNTRNIVWLLDVVSNQTFYLNVKLLDGSNKIVSLAEYLTLITTVDSSITNDIISNVSEGTVNNVLSNMTVNDALSNFSRNIK